MWWGWTGGGCVDNGSIRGELEVCETAENDYGFSTVDGRGGRRYEDGLEKDQS